MNNAQYLHPALIAVFMGIFAILSIIGFLIFWKRRQRFRSILLLCSIIIFGFCTYITATF